MNEDKFIVLDATDIICIGGFGNDKGNIDLLKYSEKEISDMVIENNNNEDNIRLINSLLGTIRNQNNRIEKAIKYIEYCQTSKNDIYPIIEIAKMMEILKGVEND